MSKRLVTSNPAQWFMFGVWLGCAVVYAIPALLLPKKCVEAMTNGGDGGIQHEPAYPRFRNHCRPDGTWEH